jgi:glycerophosphoryl diester phosphodiesterase
MLGSDSEAVERAKTHQMEWAHVQYRAITPELVADAHAANVKMMTWTVDSLEDYRKLASMGVDKICTNRPADLLDARKQTGSSG